MGWRDHCPEASWGSNCWKDCGSSSGARSTEGLQGLGVLIEAVSRVQDLRTDFLVSTCFNIFHWSWVLPTHQVVEVPVMGDTVPGNQQRTAVDLPILRREAPPEVRTEVVQGPPMPPEYVKGLVTAAPSSMANTPQRTGSVAMGSFAPPMGCWIARGVEWLSKLFEVVLTSSCLHPIKSYLGFITLYVSFLLGSCFTSRMTGGKEIVWRVNQLWHHQSTFCYPLWYPWGQMSRLLAVRVHWGSGCLTPGSLWQASGTPTGSPFSRRAWLMTIS